MRASGLFLEFRVQGPQTDFTLHPTRKDRSGAPPGLEIEKNLSLSPTMSVKTAEAPKPKLSLALNRMTVDS